MEGEAWLYLRVYYLLHTSFSSPILTFIFIKIYWNMSFNHQTLTSTDSNDWSNLYEGAWDNRFANSSESSLRHFFSLIILNYKLMDGVLCRYVELEFLSVISFGHEVSFIRRLFQLKSKYIKKKIDFKTW